METLTFEYKGNQKLNKKAYVGVVGSGDLEIIMVPRAEIDAVVTVHTRFEGYKQIWEDLLNRFFEENPIQAEIRINDFGATPGMVALRLAQGLEVAEND